MIGVLGERSYAYCGLTALLAGRCANLLAYYNWVRIRAGNNGRSIGTTG